MGKATRKQRLQSAPARTPPTPPPPPTTPRAPAPRRLGWLLLAALVAVAWAAAPRVLNPTPRSYDEYYHLGVTRLIAEHGFQDSYAGAPTLGDRWVDGAPFFHLVELPFARLPIERAGLLVSVLCLALFFASAAALLWRLDADRAPFYVLALLALGPLFAYRLSMARPQLMLLVFATLILLLLCTTREPERPRTLALLAALAALAGLAHTAGWLAIAFSTIWAVAGRLVERHLRHRGLHWKPLAATAAGWFGGQLLHPQFPGNFALHWRSGFVIPFQASGAGSEDLAAVIGAELTPLSTAQIGQQLLTFVAALLAGWLLLTNRQARTRTTLLLNGLTIAFLAAGTFKFQRMFELGAPFAIFALAATWVAVHPAGSRTGPRWRSVAALALVVVGALWSQLGVLTQTPVVSPPLAMARFLGQQAVPGEHVFTAQWGDSAPLLYFAPQVKALVALDPTVLWIEDPEQFKLFVETAYGRTPLAVRAIRERFRARWVTVWKAPAYQPLALQLARQGGKQVYDDPHYQVWDLGGVASVPSSPATR